MRLIYSFIVMFTHKPSSTIKTSYFHKFFANINTCNKLEAKDFSFYTVETLSVFFYKVITSKTLGNPELLENHLGNMMML